MGWLFQPPSTQQVLSNRAHFGGRFGFDWDSSQAFRATWQKESERFLAVKDRKIESPKERSVI